MPTRLGNGAVVPWCSLECTLACPDAAIPNTVHEIHTLVAEAVEMIEVNEPQRAAMRDHIYGIASRVREYYRADKDAGPLADLLLRGLLAVPAGSTAENESRTATRPRAAGRRRTAPASRQS